jgi:hypothetical protein
MTVSFGLFVQCFLLAFAGGGVIWIFFRLTGAKPDYPRCVLAMALLLALTGVLVVVRDSAPAGRLFSLGFVLSVLLILKVIIRENWLRTFGILLLTWIVMMTALVYQATQLKNARLHAQRAGNAAAPAAPVK